MNVIKYNQEAVTCGKVNYPLLLITIRGGITFYKIDSIDSPPRKVIASIFGEFGVIGFINILISQKKLHQNQSISSLLKQALAKGNNYNVDLTVGDIYGDGIQQVAGLHKNIIASSMGKSAHQLEDPDILDYIKSLLVMFAINVGNLGALAVRFDVTNRH